jgi:hypothetical protein
MSIRKRYCCSPRSTDVSVGVCRPVTLKNGDRLTGSITKSDSKL